MPNAYGSLLALGIGLGIFVGWLLAPRTRISRTDFADLAFVAAVAGLVGARLLHAVVDFETYRHQWAEGDRLAVLRLWEGGLVYYGGVLGGLAGVVAWARRRGLPTGDILGLLATGLPVGHAVGRVGCLLQGCCFGAPAPTLPWALDGLHPTPAYEILGEVLIFLVTLRVFLAATRTSPIRPLRALGAYLTGYALLRFVVEIFRGDAGRGFLARVELPALAETLGLPPDTPLFLSVSQGVSLLVLAGVAVAVLWPRPRSPAGHPGAPSLQ